MFAKCVKCSLVLHMRVAQSTFRSQGHRHKVLCHHVAHRCVHLLRLCPATPQKFPTCACVASRARTAPLAPSASSPASLALCLALYCLGCGVTPTGRLVMSAVRARPGRLLAGRHSRSAEKDLQRARRARSRSRSRRRRRRCCAPPPGPPRARRSRRHRSQAVPTVTAAAIAPDALCWPVVAEASASGAARPA